MYVLKIRSSNQYLNIDTDEWVDSVKNASIFEKWEWARDTYKSLMFDKNMDLMSARYSIVDIEYNGVT